MKSIVRKYAFYPPTPYGDDVPNLWIPIPDSKTGQRIPCLHVTCESTGAVPRRKRIIVLYSHGNAEDLSDINEALCLIAYNARVDVLAYDCCGG